MSLRFDIHSLPIKVIIRNSINPKGYYLGKAGIQFTNYSGDKDFLFGFSINHDKDVAKQVAIYELLERLLARYEIQYRIDEDFTRFQAFRWPDWKVVDCCSPGQLFIGKNPFCPTGVEATGLGLRMTKEAAAEHAILELIERHICAKIWYTDELPLYEVCTNIKLEGFEIYFYIISKQNITFAIAEIFSPQLEISLFGHAIRKTYEESFNKAFSEALMLLDCLLHNDNGQCSNQKTKERIISLKSDLSIKRHNYLHKKVTTKLQKEELSQNQFDCKNMVNWIFGNETISVVLLFQDNQFSVVRALSQKAKTLNEYRTSNHIEILDPFC
jgi:YcaO cyclodehydratase, ATP-ad Mg2+-binding